VRHYNSTQYCNAKTIFFYVSLPPEQHTTATRWWLPESTVTCCSPRGQVSALCLLDLTATFDTVDHELLLLRLEYQFGLRGTALMLFRSYLSGRTYRVMYAGPPVVPHLLCTSFARSHKAQSLVQYCSCCMWQTLRTLSTDTVSLFTCLPMTRSCTCIAAVKTSPRQPLGGRSASWMLVAGCPLTNRLKLNTDKTELLWTGSRHSISQLHGHGPSIQLGADTVPACDHL